MLFGEKPALNTVKSFTPKDLFQYTEILLKEYKQREITSEQKSYYGWLKSKNIQNNTAVEDLEDLRPVIQKLTPESCAAIAVKLDNLVEYTFVTSKEILNSFKDLLKEQGNLQIIEQNVRRMKDKNTTKVRVNKVHPELVPPGRQATVSFIVERELL